MVILGGGVFLMSEVPLYLALEVENSLPPLAHHLRLPPHQFRQLRCHFESYVTISHFALPFFRQSRILSLFLLHLFVHCCQIALPLRISHFVSILLRHFIEFISTL